LTLIATELRHIIEVFAESELIVAAAEKSAVSEKRNAASMAGTIVARLSHIRDHTGRTCPCIQDRSVKQSGLLARVGGH